MKTLKSGAPYLLLFLLPACGQRSMESASSGDADTDLKANDARIADARSADSGGPEIGGSGLGNSDAANPDVSSSDLKNADASNIDVPKLAASSDARGTDTPTADGARADAPGVPPQGADAGSADVPVGDTSKIDGEEADAEPAIVVNLGLAAPFAIAATAGLTNTPTAPLTRINGDVVLVAIATCNGVAVDNAGGFGACNGMPPTISGRVVTGSYPDTTTATAVSAALNAAFLSVTPLAGPPAAGSMGGGTLMAAPTTLGGVAGSPLVSGDNWFPPGVYTSITSILLTGDVTLDGQGDPNAVFIFQSASSLTTADGAPSPGAHTRILLTRGARASNVWWQVSSSATIGLYSEFQGNILAALDVTMKTGATACGRSMAGAWVGGSGAFIFDSNVVSVPGNGCPL